MSYCVYFNDQNIVNNIQYKIEIDYCCPHDCIAIENAFKQKSDCYNLCIYYFDKTIAITVTIEVETTKKRHERWSSYTQQQKL